MRVLLINLPGESVRKPEEHCGLAFLKAYLEARDICTDILDAYAKRLSITECLSCIKEWLKQGGDCYIGISPFVTSHENFIIVGEYIKRISPSVIVFAGGHYASLNKEYLLRTYGWLDAIIVGEGEASLYEMLVSPFNVNVAGVYRRRFEDKFIKRERIKDLDVLPFQARYLTPDELEGQPFAITTSRGCYGECSFCSISSFYKLNDCIKQTFRSPQSVSAEIHGLVDDYNISSLKIVDDNFFRDKSDDFLDRLVNELSDLEISFRLSARPNDITEYRAKKLKELGATVIGIGAESAHEDSLRLFNKGIDISYSDRAIKYLSDNSITCLVNFIMFNPIIDIDGVLENCLFVEKHMHESLFHRINSHLWIRATDPIVDKFVELGLCDRQGFPYIECRYKNEEILRLRGIFDIWCNHNMKEYYADADILMANGIVGNEHIYEHYKEMLEQDVEILKNLAMMYKENRLERDGEKYVRKYMEEIK